MAAKLPEAERIARHQERKRLESLRQNEIVKSNGMVKHLRHQESGYTIEDFAGEARGSIRSNGGMGEGCRWVPRRFSL